MKAKLLFFGLLLCLAVFDSISLTSYAEDTGVEINETNFPDPVFREYVSDEIDTDNDKVLSRDEIAAATEISVSKKGIDSLAGVEFFTGLQTLSCSNNALLTLDVSKNTALLVLECGDNLLSELDISENVSLTHLDCRGNDLEALSLNKNTALTELTCSVNQLTSLNLSKNKALKYLDCADNQLASLNLKYNTALDTLFCQRNNLAALDVSKNTALEWLGCYGNSILVLDIKNLPKIKSAYLEAEKASREDYDLYLGVGVLAVNKDTVILPDGNPFVDVKSGKFYYAPVMWAYTSDPRITGGTDASHFSPDDPCTRCQAVTFLWRANGCPEPKTTKSPFTDVKSGAYYYKAVLWAVENGITTGIKDAAGNPTGKFDPNGTCTRGQVVTFLYRASGSPQISTTNCPFTDVGKSAFYYQATLWAVENGITTGMKDQNGNPTGKFAPNDSCTRGHVVTFLYRNR